ncbi:unnamed protein product [Tilletia controversa]|nr:unnamed protein product [Tilletia controversa]
MFDRRQSTHPGVTHGGMDMSGHSHGSSGATGSDECYMDMLGNWRVTNVCVLTSSWHIKTTAQFVGTCVGVFFLVFLIEAIRRWGREWDRYIVRNALSDRLALRQARQQVLMSSSAASNRSLDEDDDVSSNKAREGQALSSAEQQTQRSTRVQAPLSKNRTLAKIESAFFGVPAFTSASSSAVNQTRFRPTVMQQFIRSLVYAVQFTGAYIVMLIAMTFNGYILIAIILGGFAGHFVSTWDNLSRAVDESQEEDNLLMFGSTGQSGVGTGAAATAAAADRSRRASQVQAEQRVLRYAGHGETAYGSGACCG